MMMRLLLDVSICFCPTPEPLLVVQSTSLLPYLFYVVHLFLWLSSLVSFPINIAVQCFCWQPFASHSWHMPEPISSSLCYSVNQCRFLTYNYHVCAYGLLTRKRKGAGKQKQYERLPGHSLTGVSKGHQRSRGRPHKMLTLGRHSYRAVYCIYCPVLSYESVLAHNSAHVYWQASMKSDWVNALRKN